MPSSGRTKPRRSSPHFPKQQVDAVVEACANAATEAGESLARLAVEETGYGNVPDKITKNRLASVDVPRAIRGHEAPSASSAKIARRESSKSPSPFGVVAAVIPSTNPTSTAIYKTLISLKAQNAIVLSPHPTAMRCICESAAVLSRAALKVGAPEGLIACLEHPTMQGTQELMKHRLTGVILATGGTGLVRAAYSSGKPAYGVGPGNVPALIERTANVKKAVADIFAGKTFDYGTICSSEQAIVTEEAIREQVLEECRKQGAYFLSADEIARLGALVFLGGAHVPNTKIVGNPATMIAEMAGIKVPASTRVLIARLEGIGRDFPLSAEKLSPILAFYSAPNLAAAIEICRPLLHHGGAGHTASIHSQSEAAVKQYGLAVPAFRIAVNTSSVHGSIGYSTNLFPGDDARLRLPRRQHHLRQYRPAASDEREARRLGIAPGRAPHNPSRSAPHSHAVPMQKSAAASAGFSDVGFKGLGSSLAGPHPSRRLRRVGVLTLMYVKARLQSCRNLIFRVYVLQLRVPHPSRPLRRVGILTLSVRQGTASAVPKASTNPGASAPEAIALKSTLSPIVAAAAALAPVPDRQTIARIVEQVFTARGIPRRGGSAAASKSGNLADAGALRVPHPSRPLRRVGTLPLMYVRARLFILRSEGLP